MSGAPPSPGGGAAAVPPVTGYAVPSLGWRILAAALLIIPLVILLIGIPVAILTYLSAHGIPPPISISVIEFAGAAIVALVAVRHILRPTAALGPLAIATSTATIVYLYLFLVDATRRIPIPGSGVSLSLGYGPLVLLLMIGPALAIGAGLLTLIEDVGSPKERLPFDYPA